MKNQTTRIISTIGQNMWTLATVLVCAVALAVCLWQPTNTTSARTNSTAVTSSNFKIKFDYSKAEDPDLFSDAVKEEIESSGQLLASFIGNSHEVTMIVVSDEKMSGAFASAAPSE